MVLDATDSVFENLDWFVAVFGDQDSDLAVVGGATTVMVAREDLDDPSFIAGFKTEFLPSETSSSSEVLEVIVGDFGATLIPLVIATG